MAEMTAEMDQIQVPDGGVASFMMSDEDIASLEREEDQQLAEEVYGGEGISQFTDMAAQMASLGRFGDDVIVHAQTGELVIPKKILDDNPEIKQMVFEQLMAQGIEDPEQYVVGSGSASINPETGLAEYGFFKSIRRAVSKVAKSVKKVASKVVKVAKKVAPIVLPIALTLAFPALGAYGAALGSGIGTLIQGGSFKDALKSAAISGLSSAAFSGISNIGGEGGFTGGFTKSLANPGARFSQVGGQLKSGFSGEGFNFGQDFVDPSLAAKASTTGAKTTTPTADGEVVSAQEQYMSDIMGGGEQLPAYADTQAYMGPPPTTSEGVLSEGMPAARPYTGAPGNQSISTNTPFEPQPTKFSLDEAYKTAKEYATTGYDKGKDLLFGAPEKSVSDVLKDPSFIEKYGKLDPGVQLEYAKTFSGETQKNLLQQVAPYALTGGALMYGAGMFKTPKPTPDEDAPLGLKNSPTGIDLFQADPSKYTVDVATPATITYSAPVTQYASYSDFYNPLPTALASSRPTVDSPFYRPPVQTAAQGGEIFPRRTGGIMPDEGIPGKDSVRAMLMPGEFVMTTDAVKGMGDGNLRRGIQNMYGVMANLERKGRMA